MISRIVVLTTMLAILFSLGSGLYYLVTDEGKGNRLVKALTWRISLSLLLFLSLLLGYHFGYLHPHGL
jgi:Protein of unknown function (DUF2909)